MLPFPDPVPLNGRPPSAARRARRLAATAAAFIRRMGEVPLARHRGSEHGLSTAVRTAFDDLGVTYVKFGQLVGSSPSAVGDEVAGEFRSCLDQGPPLPPGVARKTVARELGVPVAELF